MAHRSDSPPLLRASEPLLQLPTGNQRALRTWRNALVHQFGLACFDAIVIYLVAAEQRLATEFTSGRSVLHTRALIPNTTHSTASRRGPGATPSNLLFTAEKPLTAEQLKAELIRMVKQRNLEYGILVRRMSNPQLAVSLARSRVIMFSSSNGPGSITVEPLLEAFKVFPDGHEEQVRNLNVTGLTMGDFRNIIAVSEPSSVYSAPVRITSRTPFAAIAFLQPGGPSVVSAAVPSMLFEDMSLQRPSGDIPNLPFSTHPFFDR